MSIVKKIIKPEELLVNSYALANYVLKTYKPTFMVALWRGGSSIGIAMHEFFKFKKCYPDHIAIRTKHYIGIGKTGGVEVDGLDYIINHANAEDKLLIVDDVFETGKSILEVIKQLKEKMRKNCPEIKVATVYYKKVNDLCPDFYVETSKDWLVFPHELEDLTIEEIAKKGEKVAKFFK